MKNKKILVILPHPDDEVFPMSGTLSQLIRDGNTISYGCLTLGEMGRNLGSPAFANRITLPSVRKKELEQSCKAIGISDLRLLGFHDKTLEFESEDLLDEAVASLIDSVQPDIIFTFYPGYGVHPDHNACGATVIRVVGKMLPEERPTVYCSAFPTDNDLGPPDVVNDIRPTIHQKIASLRSHSSQFQLEELNQPDPESNPKLLERIGTEQFWIYPFR